MTAHSPECLEYLWTQLRKCLPIAHYISSIAWVADEKKDERTGFYPQEDYSIWEKKLMGKYITMLYIKKMTACKGSYATYGEGYQTQHGSRKGKVRKTIFQERYT